MKKLFKIIIVSLLLVGCRAYADGFFIVLSNNTDEVQKVGIRFTSTKIVLAPYSNFEFYVSDGDIGFNTKYGYIGECITEDTTVEINPNCYYIGETPHRYWKEGE